MAANVGVALTTRWRGAGPDRREGAGVLLPTSPPRRDEGRWDRHRCLTSRNICGLGIARCGDGGSRPRYGKRAAGNYMPAVLREACSCSSARRQAGAALLMRLDVAQREDTCAAASCPRLMPWDCRGAMTGLAISGSFACAGLWSRAIPSGAVWLRSWRWRWRRSQVARRSDVRRGCCHLAAGVRNRDLGALLAGSFSSTGIA